MRGPVALEYQALLVNTLGASPWATQRAKSLSDGDCFLCHFLVDFFLGSFLEFNVGDIFDPDFGFPGTFRSEIVGVSSVSSNHPQPSKVTVHHLASDDYVRQEATFWRQQLRPDVMVYVEHSNEVWNPLFAQGRFATQKARGEVGDHEDGRKGGTWPRESGVFFNKIVRTLGELFLVHCCEIA